MQIGKLKLKSNLIAAPLAGFSDAAWRTIVHEMGAGLTFSEMISVEGLVRAQKKTERYLKNYSSSGPFGVQLFGSKSESFRSVFKVLENYKFDVIDINMGCPVKKVVSKGAGSALMKTPKVVEEILRSVRKVYHGPLTVKIRSGWNDDNINAVEIAKIAEGSGADAIIVHPRTREQGFKGHSDWNIISQVKANVKIPVIGNGDILNKNDIDKMLKETGCDGVMIGRAALGNPWLFLPNPCLPAGRLPLKGREFYTSPPFKGELEGVFALVRHHIELLRKNESEQYALTMMKKFVPKYLKGLSGHKTLVQKIHSGKSADDILDSLASFEHLHQDGN